MKLYDCLIAPNPRRVRIFLDEKKIQVEKQEVDILAGENLKPEFIAVNPRGVVPVLELDDGTRIDEAAAIWRYFEETQPDPPLMGRNPKERAIVESWERRADQDGMLSARDMIRNQVPVFVGRGHPGRSIDAQIPGLVSRGQNGMKAFHELLEKQLEKSEFLATDHFTVADITALCAVELGILGGYPGLDGYPAIRRWHTAVSARPSVEDWVSNIQAALGALES